MVRTGTPEAWLFIVVSESPLEPSAEEAVIEGTEELSGMATAGLNRVL